MSHKLWLLNNDRIWAIVPFSTITLLWPHVQVFRVVDVWLQFLDGELPSVWQWRIRRSSRATETTLNSVFLRHLVRLPSSVYSSSHYPFSIFSSSTRSHNLIVACKETNFGLYVARISSLLNKVPTVQVQ